MPSKFRISSRRRAARPVARRLGRWFRGRVEALEHRRLLAATVAVVPGSIGAGSLDSTFITNGGMLPLATPDVGSDTLSAGALASIGPASDIVVDAQGAITFNNSGAGLTLQTGAANGVSFVSSTGAVTFASSTDSLATSGGRITLEAGLGSQLTAGNLNSQGGEIDLSADSMLLQAAVDAGPAAVVHLDVASAAKPISLGTTTLGGTLNLPETALNEITAAVLEIGSTADNGGLTITSPIALGTTPTGNLNNLDVRNGGPIAENAGGSIAVYALALQSGDGVSMATSSNGVSNLAFDNTVGDFKFVNGQSLSIASVDDLTAASNTGGTTELTSSGPLTIATTVTSAGTLTAKTTANANPGVPAGVMSVNAGDTVESTGGNILLESVNSLDIPSGADVHSDTGTVTLVADFGATTANTSTAIAGTVDGTSVTVVGGSNLSIDFTGGAAVPHGLSFNGGTNASLTISDQGGTATHVYVIDVNNVVRDGAAPIAFNGGTSSVTITGADSAGPAGDTFNVTPSAKVAFTLNGGGPNPPASPGDVLIAPVGGTLTNSFDSNNGYFGTWDFTGDQPITFAGFETLQFPPTITSVNGATFTVGSSSSFSVTTHGLPSPSVTESGALPGGVTFDSSTNTLGGTPVAGSGGIYDLSLDASNGVGADATQGFTLTVDEAATFTSPSSAAFGLGTAGSFSVAASGFPVPSITELGTLPNGVKFNANTGVLQGTPAAGSSGVYSITFTASNGIGSNANQNFTLSVTQPQAPAITSAANVTFAAGTPGTFSVTASGVPMPTLSESGPLPAGVTFDAASGVLSGTASAGTGGTYPLTFQATSGAGSTSQNFVLTVDEGPSITSANNTTFTPATLGNFTVTTGGFPAPSVTESGALPNGVTFDAATGKLLGMPAAGTTGNYPLSFTAHNGIGSDATQNFTLAVDQAPAFTSNNATTFTVGASSSFAVTASGFPAPTIGESGALPNGVSFDATTAKLTGMPNQGTGGTYPITLSATNGFGSAASQSFTLTVDQVPSITSGTSANFIENVHGSFTVTATGFPAPTVGESGPLPGGLSFDAATATLSGTPNTGTAGVYKINVTAANGAGADVQSFTIVVVQSQAPAFSSANGVTFNAGAPGTFTVAASGVPVPSLSESGPLPNLVTFDAATGVLAGTPAAGTGGSYAIQFTAANGIGSHAVQPFTLAIDEAASITSANAATFTAGTPGSFAITTSGFPSPTVSENGTLPIGVTFDPTTGLLAGTPGVGSGGSYAVSFTAHNGVGSDATQNFTLNVNEAPAITSANAVTFNALAAASFTVTAIGSPAPTLSEAGALPSGVTFDPTSGLLSGTPALDADGIYPISFTAHNGVGSDATQNFTLTVDQLPLISCALSTSFADAAFGSFTVFARGFPEPTLSENGPLPKGITFDPASGLLSGTPAAGTDGVYQFRFMAVNGAGPFDSRTFTLTIAPAQAPAITSANSASFNAGSPGKFFVTLTGVPTPTLTESGVLPNGLVFDPPGGISYGFVPGKLSGTLANGSGGVYDLTFTASNGIGPDVSQNFALTVDEAPTITSANATTFVAGTAGSFMVTTSGFPASTFSESGALPGGVTFDPTTGTLAGTPGAGTGGNYKLSFTAANGIGHAVTQNFTLSVDEAPSFTSASSTTFTVGAAGNFVVAAGGFPKPSFSESGALPSGVSFNTATDLLIGKPAAGSGGTYPIRFTAHNGAGNDATQNFTLTVDQAPTITSANSAIFGVGMPGSFMLTTSGFPAPSLSETGPLPNGVSFDPTTNTLSGTPATGTNGSYSISFTAHNGIGSDATQNFTLTVGTPTAITSATSTTFTTGTSGSFTVKASGLPAPTLSESGTLPAGVTFNAAQGILGGKPVPGTGGTYNISFTAHNGIGSDATQSFTLTVDQAPAITSAAGTTFTAGTDGNFVVTMTGFPTPTLTETGALPTGVTFDAASGTLSGTPNAGSGGTYPITFDATNGIGADATQAFIVTVDVAPAITSAAAVTFVTSTPGSFAVTAGGFPAPSVSETGTLPNGMTFNANSGTLGGRPLPGTGGTYDLTFTAHNGVGRDAVQNFVLTVDQPPAITSARGVVFGINLPGTFSVTASGFPAPTFSEAGNLPAGLNFDAASGTLAGTAQVGTLGSYTLTFTAHNGIGNDASQTFTLDVVPARPTANADTFVLSRSASSTGTGTTSVLANDISGDSQPQSLVATVVAKTTLGHMALNHDGSFTYAPGASFQGLDRFSYQISEGPVTGNTVTVTLLSYQASIVDKLYHQVLGRSADDQGLQFWTSQIMHGASYGLVAQGLFESNERLDAIIAGGQLGSITYPGYYPQYLLRPADPAGLAYWEGIWKQDGGPDNVIAGMIGSPEFYQSAGMQHPTLSANAAWVTALYERLLNREPDMAGLSYWTGRLDDGSMTRQEVVLGFVESPENFTNLTNGFFMQYLNRQPSASELAQYVAEFEAGATQRDIQLAIINLPEYANTPPPPAAGTVGLPLYPF
jgi:hypothetical protein